MTDQIPADKVRTILDEWERIKEHADWDDIDNLVQDVRALLPTPPRPTLADMTDEERSECQWMQADVDQLGRVIIVAPGRTDNLAQLIDRWGSVAYGAHDTVTPRPDLPRLGWPGDEKPDPAPALPDGWRLADHKKHGRVIVTNPTPNRSGHVCYVLPDDAPRGYDWLFCDPDRLTYIDTDQGVDTSGAVPESTLAVGSVWDDTDALTRACEETGRDHIAVTDRNGGVSVWDARRDDWRGHYRAVPKYAPYTIIHTGQEDDQ